MVTKCRDLSNVSNIFFGGHAIVGGQWVKVLRYFHILSQSLEKFGNEICETEFCFVLVFGLCFCLKLEKPIRRTMLYF